MYHYSWSGRLFHYNSFWKNECSACSWNYDGCIYNVTGFYCLWCISAAIWRAPRLTAIAVWMLVIQKNPAVTAFEWSYSLGASMTCTPSLAVLMQMAGTDSIAAAYITTYPIALIVVIFVVQILVKL